MPRGNFPVYALNGGEVGKDAIARFDLDRLRYAATLQDNILPHVIGKMQFRPGFEDVGSYVDGVRMIPFIVSGDSTFLLIFTPLRMEVIQGAEYLERPVVSTVIADGTFDSFAAWTDISTGGGSATASGGNLVLANVSGGTSGARQQVTVAAPDQNVEHGLSVDVVRGPVTVRIGTTSGGSDLMGPFELEEGEHSLSFTPTGSSFWIELTTDENRTILVNRARMEVVQRVRVETPWGADDLPSLRYDQSLDVMYVASDGFQQRQIERRGDRSWSLVRYKTSDGPFAIEPQSTITVTPSVLSNVGTLTASSDLFSSGDIGSLFRLTHSQQFVEETFTGVGQTSENVRVTGVGESQRSFTVVVDVDGSWSGNIRLERSIAEPGDWTTIRNYTADETESITDGLDNQISFFRLNVTSHTAGTATASIRYNGGTTIGVARIVGFTSETVVDMEVLTPFGSTDATTTWDRGEWSDARGWPNTVALHDGRLWWGRDDVLYGSESDRYQSYNDETEGDSAPVIRSIGAGAQQGIVWIQSLQRLMVGTDVSEVSVRASSFDEPLTAAAFVPRRASTRGCADIAPVEVDTSAVFVQRSGFRIFDMTFDGGAQDYVSRDITELHTDVCRPSVVSMAVQRQPDTRIWFVLSDGTVRALTYEPSENIIAWSRVTVDGFVEDVEVLPSSVEDRVYISVNRNIAGGTQRRIERMARVDQAIGGTINMMADSFVHVTNSPASTTVSGLDHLDGEQVVVWADGQAVNDQSNMLTVASGSITLAAAATEVVVGVPYTGQWKSTKLAYGAGGGTALSMYKRVNHLGLYLVDTVLQGIRIGRAFTRLTGLSRTDRGKVLDFSATQSEFDVDLQELNGAWDVDSRVCIQMQSPYPVSVAAMVLALTTNDK